MDTNQIYDSVIGYWNENIKPAVSDKIDGGFYRAMQGLKGQISTISNGEVSEPLKKSFENTRKMFDFKFNAVEPWITHSPVMIEKLKSLEESLSNKE